MKKTPLKTHAEPKSRRDVKAQCRSLERCESFGYWEEGGARSIPVWHPHRYHAAHIFGTQSYPNIAEDPRNLICLCENCHKWFHAHTGEWPKFVDWLRGEGYYESLKLEANLALKGEI